MNENLVEQMQAERTRAEKAEAACAEMRMLVAFLACCCNSGESLNDEDKKQVNHALSADCGKATLERIEKLRSASLAIEAYCIDYPETVRDIPDEIWVPFRQALEETK